MTTIEARKIRNPWKRLRAGCYATRFVASWRDDYPDQNTYYEGTLRVEHRDAEGNPLRAEDKKQRKPGDCVRASGDLYAVKEDEARPAPQSIPIYPREDYRFFLWVTAIDADEPDGFTLRCESHGFEGGQWKFQDEIKIKMKWTKPPGGSAADYDYLEGEAKDSNDTPVGKLTATWVSDYLRQAVVEIDSVVGVDPPEGCKDPKIDWQSVFAQADWDLKQETSDKVSEPYPGREWSDEDLFGAMLTLRDSLAVDNEWRYYLLCVGNIEGYGRGFMFDRQGGDLGNLFLETAAIAGDWRFEDPGLWGTVQGQPLKETSLFFRTAVHEIGHCMNLAHNTTDNGFMNTTDAIAENIKTEREEAQASIEKLAKDGLLSKEAADTARRRNGDSHGLQFPDNVQFSFAPDDRDRLRHWPDIVVRPGSPGGLVTLPKIREAPFLDRADSPGLAVETQAFDLVVRPLLKEVPLGAPVRVQLELKNRSSEELKVPRLSLKSGAMSGKVRTPHDGERAFCALAYPGDGFDLTTLEPGKSITGSITLLRGPDQALFPTPGEHEITVEMAWSCGRVEHSIAGSTTVAITPVRDKAHQRAAERILKSPDALLSLAFGGDYLAEGNQAVNAALNNEVLKPHLAIIQIRRWIQGLDEIPGNIDRLVQMLGGKLNEEIVLGVSEIRRIQELIRAKITAEELHRLAMLILIGGVNGKRVEEIAGEIRARQKSPDRFNQVASVLESDQKPDKKAEKVGALAPLLRDAGFGEKESEHLAGFILAGGEILVRPLVDWLRSEANQSGDTSRQRERLHAIAKALNAGVPEVQRLCKLFEVGGATSETLEKAAVRIMKQSPLAAAPEVQERLAEEFLKAGLFKNKKVPDILRRVQDTPDEAVDRGEDVSGAAYEAGVTVGWIDTLAPLLSRVGLSEKRSRLAAKSIHAIRASKPEFVAGLTKWLASCAGLDEQVRSLADKVVTTRDKDAIRVLRLLREAVRPTEEEQRMITAQIINLAANRPGADPPRDRNRVSNLLAQAGFKLS